MENQNIVLIGFMGSGKTTIGKHLAFLLKYKFIDMDRYIEEKQSTTITDIFQSYGEAYFRTLEKKTAEELSKRKRCIIATGGGVIKDPSVIGFLSSTGKIVYLKAEPYHIYNNLNGDNSRPLLEVDDKMARIQELLKERTPLYEKYGQITVEVSGETVNAIADRIIEAMGEKL